MRNGNLDYKIENLEQQLNSLKQAAEDPVQLKESMPALFEKLQNILTELQQAQAELRRQREEKAGNNKYSETGLSETHEELTLGEEDSALEYRKANLTPVQQSAEYEQAAELRTHMRQQAIIAQLGQRALAGVNLYTLMDEAIAIVTETLKTEYCQILELLPHDDSLLLRAGMGWQDGLVGRVIVSADINSQMGYTLLSSEPVIVEDLRTETRFSALPLLHDHGVVSSLSVIVDGQNWPFGVLGTHTTRRRTFTTDDINFLQAIANVLAQAIERKQAEEALRESEDRYRRMIEFSFEAIVIHDEKEFIYINEAGARLYGATHPNRMIGKPIFDFVHRGYLNMIKSRLEQASEENEDVSLVKEKLIRFDGTSVDVEMVAIPITYQGRPTIQVVARDISERERAQRILKESEEKYRTLIQQSQDAIYLIYGGKFELINRKFEELFGVSQEDITDSSFVFTNIVAPKSRRFVMEQAAKEGAKANVSPRYEFTALDKDGNEIEVELTVSYPTYKRGLATQGVLRDITQRKKAEAEREALLAAEHEQRLLAETLGEVFLALTSQTSHSAVLDEILRQVQRVVSYDAANIMLLEDNSLHLAHHQNYDSLGGHDLPPNLMQSLTNFPLDAEVVQSRQSVVVPDTSQNPLWVATPESDWTRSFVAVPICLHDRVLGLLRLDSSTPDKFSQKDLEALQPLANGAAIALENARLYDELEQRVEERTAELLNANKILKEQIAERKSTEKALRKSESKYRATANELTALTTSQERLLTEKESILNITRALVSTTTLNNLLDFIISQAMYLANVEGAAVLLLSDDEQNFKVTRPGEWLSQIDSDLKIPVQESLAGVAITKGEVQISNDAQNDDRIASIRALLPLVDIHSLLCAPLVVQEKSLGVLLMWNKCEQDFNIDDNRLMGLFADQAALALHNAHLHARNRQLAIEQERHRLARELHDSVTQSLYSIALAAKTSLKLLDQANAKDKLRDTIEYIQSFSQTGLTEIRAQLYNLHPPALDKGLVKALLEHCDILMGQYALTIELKTGSELSLSMYQQEGLYYIAREALWNITKHASATHVEISLTQNNDQMELSITDNGKGFDPSVTVKKPTTGLVNMEERAKLLGGGLELHSKPGQGAQVIAWIPSRWP